MDITQRRHDGSNALPDNGFRLATLGTLSLVDGQGASDQSLARRRRKLAVLAVLAVAGRPVCRDRLEEMFWGDDEESRARHSLSDTLSNLRRVLGPDAIVTRQLEISLSPSCPLVVDAVELMEAAERRDHARVVAMYAGPFMYGVDVPDSPSFERWVTPLRERVRRYWLEACAAQCLALARTRKWDECAILARRWLDEDVASADAALYLLNALKAPGTPEAYRSTLDEYGILEQRLKQESGRTAAPEVARLADSVRDELARVVAPAAATVSASAAPASPVTVHGPSTDRPRRPAVGVRHIARSRFASVAFTAALVLGATSFTASRAASRPAHGPEVRPSIAVVDVRNVTRDSTSAWLEVGFPQMVASGLSRIPGIEVISAERVREARKAFGLEQGVTLTGSDVGRLGARSGARWAVSASITPGDSVYALHVTVQDTADPISTHRFTMTSPSLLALADETAATLASLATTTVAPSAPTEVAIAGGKRPY
jgi:DNA-binding SARP family transcriptional activator/TolB-like protein